jgi:hypothetical protein
MIIAFYNRNASVSFLAAISVLSMALILVIPQPSFADRIIIVRQYTTLTVSCDLNNGNDVIDDTNIFNYNQPTKLTVNCERPGGDIDLKKSESITLQCLHDNPLTIPKHAKMKSGELFYILCK